MAFVGSFLGYTVGFSRGVFFGLACAVWLFLLLLAVPDKTGSRTSWRAWREHFSIILRKNANNEYENLHGDVIEKDMLLWLFFRNTCLLNDICWMGLLIGIILGVLATIIIPNNVTVIM